MSDSQQSNIRIGIDSFCYHRYFGETTAWEKPVGARWQTEDFLRRAAEIGVKIVALQTTYMPKLTLDTVGELQAQLDKFGLEAILAWGHRSGLEGGMNPQKVESLHKMLHVAKALNTKLMRFVCGDPTFFHIPAEERLARLVPIVRDAAAKAADLALDLAVENHGDLAMHDVVALVERVGANNLGIWFDTGNGVRLGDDLMESVKLARRWIRMIHVKDMVVIPESVGDPNRWWPAAPLGRGHQDLPGFLSFLQSTDWHGVMFVETPNMHSDYPDEDAAVVEGVAYLHKHLKS